MNNHVPKAGAIGDLSNKVALVTGASSGIGRGIALAYAAAGAFVVSADITPSPPKTTMLPIDAAGPSPGTPTVSLINKLYSTQGQNAASPRASYISCDVSRAEQVEAAVAFAVKMYGRLDILVNNASVSGEDQAYPNLDTPPRLHDADVAVLDRDWSINVRGTWLCCKFALVQMMKQEPHVSGDRGWIISMGSTLGLVALPGYTCYSATKGAVAMLTKAIAVEYAKDRIHVNCIHPGSIETPILEALKQAKGLEAFNNLFLSKYPWPRLGMPQDVAKVAVFLAGVGSDWMTRSTRTMSKSTVPTLETPVPPLDGATAEFPHPYVMLVTIQREKKMNSIPLALHWQLHHLFEWFDHDPNLRVAVITGAGKKAFCAGQDLIELGSKAKADSARFLATQPPSGFAGLSRRVGRKPIIAAVNGYALAGGFEMTLNCDIVVASPAARFGLPEVLRGIYAGAGGLPRLMRNCGQHIASEIALTGRQMSAQQAAKYLLINRIASSPDTVVPEALAIAQDLANISPDAILVTRAALREAWETASVERGRQLVDARYMRALINGDNAKEGLAAFAEKRSPRWEASKL